jgi:hypothetical protein
MTTETFRTDLGNLITVQPMWGGYRVVLANDTFSRIGKTSYATREEALGVLRANSTRVS